MKRFKLVGLLLVFSLAACAPVVQEEEESLSIVTSFYPIYLLAKEITMDVEGITLSNMAQPQSGCLHEYELSTRDMKVLAQGEVLLLNGGGMEGFLEDAIERFPELLVIDTSAGIPLLTGEDAHGTEEGHGAEEGVGNAHLWLSPDLCKQQVANMVNDISALVPAERQRIEENGRRLLKEMEDLTEGLSMEKIEEVNVAIFHEGFAYFHPWLGLHPSIQIFAEEYKTPTAQELVAAVEVAKAEGVVYFLAAEDAGLPYARILAEECGGKLLMLDPMTTGDLETGSYMETMRENMKWIRYVCTKEERNEP